MSMAAYLNNTSLTSSDPFLVADVTLMVEKNRRDKNEQRQLTATVFQEQLAAVGRAVKKAPSDQFHSIENITANTKNAKIMDSRCNYIDLNNSPSPQEILSQRYGFGSRWVCFAQTITAGNEGITKP